MIISHGWFLSISSCYEVRGKTLGVIGYGHVGSQLSVLAEAMGMRVIFYDIEPKLCLGNASQVQTLDEVLGTADFVSLHVPADLSTKNMINAEKIQAVSMLSFSCVRMYECLFTFITTISIIIQ